MDTDSQTIGSGPRPTRRQLLTDTALAFCGLGLCTNVARALDGQEVSRAEESIHQEVLFKAHRNRVYDALTVAKHFDKVVRLSAASSEMSLGKAPTAISSHVGGAFELFGGHILGRHIELVPVERIVQAWRVATWDPGYYSIARFVLLEHVSGTQLIFDHVGFPKGEADHLATGWKTNYWEPLEKALA